MPDVILNVTSEEWADANAFFRKNPAESEYRKRETNAGKNDVRQSHSFLNIEGKIIALNNTQHYGFEKDAGKGAFARVKRAIDENGNTYVVKVQGESVDPMPPEMEEVMRSSGYLKGQSKTTRKGGRVKAIDVYDTDVKIRTVYEYRGDRDLFSELFEKGTPFSAAEKRVLILRTMMGIEALHRLGILHCDIKPENFMVNGNGVDLTVLPIDFDHSMMLKPGETSIKGTTKGTPGFISPEIYSKTMRDGDKGTFSFASDVFALGKLLQVMIISQSKECDKILSGFKKQLPEKIDLSSINVRKVFQNVMSAPDVFLLELAQMMTEFKPEDRVSLKEAMEKIIEDIKLNFNKKDRVYYPVVNKALQDYQAFMTAPNSAFVHGPVNVLSVKLEDLLQSGSVVQDQVTPQQVLSSSAVSLVSVSQSKDKLKGENKDHLKNQSKDKLNSANQPRGPKA